MILYKSLAKVKEEKQKMQEKMKHAQDFKHVKSRVNTHRPKSEIKKFRSTKKKEKTSSTAGTKMRSSRIKYASQHAYESEKK